MTPSLARGQQQAPAGPPGQDFIADFRPGPAPEQRQPQLSPSATLSRPSAIPIARPQLLPTDKRLPINLDTMLQLADVEPIDGRVAAAQTRMTTNAECRSL
jgi:hypothetical protein